MRELVTLKDNEKFLRQVSKEVDIKNDKNLLQDIEDLKEYSLANAVYAMAAVQIGIPKRLLFVKSVDEGQNTAKEKDQIVMINPKILSQKGKTEYLEACQSCLEYAGWVERPYEIKVRYQDFKGKTFTKTFSGFVATILSHEIDHLDGIVHMDRTDKVFKMPVEKRVEFRKIHPYKIISKDCEFEYPPLKKFQITQKSK